MSKHHKFGDYHHLEINGRIKKSLGFPLRERLLVRRALERLGLRYREAIPFFNPNRDTVQWLDFVVLMPNKRIIVLLFGKRTPGGWMKRELEAIQQKQAYLKIKGIPCMLLSRSLTSQMYQVQIQMTVRKELLKHDSGKHTI